MNSKNHFTFIDLFAGIGGFRLALSSMGGECVFSSEIDEKAKLVYQKNFHEIPSGDITKIKNNEIPAHDVLCAGFPCQAFSVSGKRLGFNDHRGTMFFEILRIAKSKKPKIIFLENVKNFYRHDNGRTFKIVSESLSKIGYNVYSQVLTSSDYGVPQQRERIYIVAIRKNLNINHFEFPKKSNKTKTVKDIIQNLNKNELADLIINRKDINIYRSCKKIENHSRPFQIGVINKGGQGERIYSIYGQGITLSAHGGGAAAKTGAYLVGKTIRKLHVKECLLMQGFPKSFKMLNNRNESYKQLGNSVSVPVLKSIFKKVIELKIL